MTGQGLPGSSAQDLPDAVLATRVVHRLGQQDADTGAQVCRPGAADAFPGLSAPPGNVLVRLR